MYEKTVKARDTIVIFCPFQLINFRRCYFVGDLKLFDEYITIFFITKLYETCKPRACWSIYGKTSWDGNESRLTLLKDWIYIEIIKNNLSIKRLQIKGELKEFTSYHIIWINYDFSKFSECEIMSMEAFGPYCDRSYFKYFKEKINNTKQTKLSQPSQIKSTFLALLSTAVLKLSENSLKLLPVSKYFNVALHIDNYLNGLVWAIQSIREKKRLDIKVKNLLLSVFLDMILGIFLLNWLNSKVSLDSSSTLFLLTAESVVNSIKDLISWLRGDPAGLKLNWAFNKVLATFFLFHIDIWWTFIAYLEPIVKIIFYVFLKLGLLGITFQASITADLLALVSFHVYCIYAYAAKLYYIQISSLISLWRLFLGRKKNPLRGKVDSCRYSPEQLFVGTLAFTILLFLLPTTLLYYIVFTCIRLLILILQGILMLIRHLNQTLPIYSTFLWLMRSSKVSAGIEIVSQNSEFLKADFLLKTVKPATCSWLETVQYFLPDCAPKPRGINISDILRALIYGKRIFPI